MAPLDAFENRVLAQLIAMLQAIGTPTTSWLTTPESVEEGVPGEAVTIQLKPKLFVQVATSSPQTPAAPISVHKWHTTFNVWCCDSTMRGVLQLKADVLRAVYANEDAIFSAFQSMLGPSAFQFNSAMTSGGVWIGLQQLQMDYETTHAAP